MKKKTEEYANRTTILNPKKQQQILENFYNTITIRTFVQKQEEKKVSRCISKPNSKTTCIRLIHILPFLYCPRGRSPRDQSVFAKKKQNRKKNKLG